MYKGFLFDASSLIYAFKLRKLDVLIGNCIQWLTMYEVINGLWKGVYLTKTLTIEEVSAMIKVLKEVMKYMNVLDLREREEEILKLALRLE